MRSPTPEQSLARLKVAARRTERDLARWARAKVVVREGMTQREATERSFLRGCELLAEFLGAREALRERGRGEHHGEVEA